MATLQLLYKSIRFFFIKLNGIYYLMLTKLKLLVNNVDYKGGLISIGSPIVNVKIGSKFSIGKHFMMNNGKFGSITGMQARCSFWVDKDAKLIIGDNVGLNSVSIGCFKEIVIGNNIRIGGGTVIYDTNFHSLNVTERTQLPENTEHVVKKSVKIADGAFIGARCIISKGVTIGENTIVAAGSIVVKDIPANEIWGGNPAKFIKKLN